VPEASDGSAPTPPPVPTKTQPGRVLPLFSQISQDYIDMRIARDGEDHPDIQSLVLRRQVFIDVVGDRTPVEYFPSDLQTFVSRMQCFPSNVAKRSDFDGKSTLEILEANKNFAVAPPMAKKTMADGYLANVKTMMRHGTQQSAFLWQRVRDRGDIPVCRCNPDALHDAIEVARGAGIEVLLIDMPPDLRHVPQAARCSDLVIIPMRPTLFDLQVTRGLIPLLTSVGVRYAVVINAAPPIRDHGDSPMVRQTREALAHVGPRLWRRQITSRVTIPYSTMRGAAVVETEPDGLAAHEYRALWNAVRNTLKLEGVVDETV
jgi:chromosome partitioning protein